MISESLRALVLGILQGLTEFLPISSSAHLILLPWLLDWEPFGLTFDIMVHGGTFAAVLIYFRRDWFRLLQTCGKGLGSGSGGRPEDRSLLLALALGTIPSVVAGFVAYDWIERNARGPEVIVVTLSVFALALWFADRTGSRLRSLSQLRAVDGLWVGMAQILAFVPGVSRSGVTIAMALLLGFSRQDSARFSFLLAGPVILLAVGKGVLDLITEAGEPSISAPALLLGVLSSCVAGFLCIRFLLRYLKVGSFLPFVVYRLILAAVILLGIVQ